MNDKATEALLEVLKQCLAEPGEQRLYKSGKLPGLFPARTGVNGEAATLALNEGLLEVVRTETKGKVTTEWVRSTPRAIEFLHKHESPVQALKDLQAILQVNQQKILEHSRFANEFGRRLPLTGPVRSDKFDLAAQNAVALDGIKGRPAAVGVDRTLNHIFRARGVLLVLGLSTRIG